MLTDSGIRGQNPKLLSPTHSFEGAVRVIRAGADEIYCGVRNPRIKYFRLHRGPPFDIPTYEELGKVVKHAHDNGVEVLLTANWPFMAEKLEDAMKEHLHLCLNQGVDAVIIGDLGVLSLVRAMDVDARLYASTYLITVNYEAVDFLRKLGFSRVILERHVTMPEIAEIAKHSKIEIEVFIHGWGCPNMEGRCHLFHFDYPPLNRARSTVTSGVANPCTIPFEIYNSDGKGLIENVPITDAYTCCAMCRIPELVQAGVAGFKIVGRGEHIEYQENTTKIYRELLDLVTQDQMKAFWKKVESHKRNLIPNPPTLVNLKEFGCEQKRCYYSHLFHTPYRLPISWRAWTKFQFKHLVVK